MKKILLNINLRNSQNYILNNRIKNNLYFDILYKNEIKNANNNYFNNKEIEVFYTKSLLGLVLIIYKFFNKIEFHINLNKLFLLFIIDIYFLYYFFINQFLINWINMVYDDIFILSCIVLFILIIVNSYFLKIYFELKYKNLLILNPIKKIYKIIKNEK